MYLSLFGEIFPGSVSLCVSLNYGRVAESDDLPCSSGRGGVPGRGPGHHGAVHRQVESSIQDEEIC